MSPLPCPQDLREPHTLVPAECPAITPRCLWGARPYRGTPALLQPPLGSVFLHHTLEPSQPCQSFGACTRAMRDMQRFHQDTRGWDDIGYRSLSPPWGDGTCHGPWHPLWERSLYLCGDCHLHWFPPSMSHVIPCGPHHLLQFLSPTMVPVTPWGAGTHHSPCHPPSYCHCTPVGIVTPTVPVTSCGPCHCSPVGTVTPTIPVTPPDPLIVPLWALSPPLVPSTLHGANPCLPMVPVYPHGHPVIPCGPHHCPIAVHVIVTSQIPPLSSHSPHHCPPMAPTIVPPQSRPLSLHGPHNCPSMVLTTVPLQSPPLSLHGPHHCPSQSPFLSPHCPHNPHSPHPCPFPVPITVPSQSPSLLTHSPHSHFPFCLHKPP